MTTEPGSSGLPRESSPTKIRADAIAILVLGFASGASIIALAWQKFTDTFTSGGVVWQLPVSPQPATAEGLQVYTSAGLLNASPIEGVITHLQVTIPNLNTVSSVCLGAAIVLAAITLFIVVGSTARIAWLFQQGRFFTLPTSHALRILTWALGAGGFGAFAAWNLGANGVEAALNVRASDTGSGEWWGWYFIVLFAVSSFGLIDIALRRAIRVQHDAEGLV
ncbi:MULTISPECIES: hypothetical protein [unclassified Leucobacter]|uniref:hypothetical protein n=1 Tax=unclassified Leucobacter TaxID=2621730 RepID=UPI00165D92D5|nr:MULTISPECIES: hypothetical protein [unclassified Leucobacter]MBC9927694.1 hypothetical protein [Leucobacter sp. cx-169]